MELREAARAQGPEIPPKYPATCMCDNCGRPSAWTLVMYLWPIDKPRTLRGKVNAVPMFPAIVACEEHKFRLRDIGLLSLKAAHGYAKDLFKSLSHEPPDMTDVLIDAQPIDEALKLWLAPPAH